MWFFFFLWVYIFFLVDYVNGFSYTEPTLHPWNEVYLIVVNDGFDVFLDSVCENCIETLRTQRVLRWHAPQWGEGLVESTCSRKTGQQLEGWGCHSTVKNSDQNCSCLKELQGQKWRRAWRKGGPGTGPNLDPTQGEAPRPDTITDAMVYLQTGAYHDCPLKGPTSSWKSQR